MVCASIELHLEVPCMHCKCIIVDTCMQAQQLNEQLTIAWGWTSVVVGLRYALDQQPVSTLEEIKYQSHAHSDYYIPYITIHYDSLYPQNVSLLELTHNGRRGVARIWERGVLGMNGLSELPVHGVHWWCKMCSNGGSGGTPPENFCCYMLWDWF